MISKLRTSQDRIKIISIPPRPSNGITGHWRTITQIPNKFLFTVWKTKRIVTSKKFYSFKTIWLSLVSQSVSGQYSTGPGSIIIHSFWHLTLNCFSLSLSLSGLILDTCSESKKIIQNTLLQTKKPLAKLYTTICQSS